MGTPTREVVSSTSILLYIIMKATSLTLCAILLTSVLLIHGYPLQDLPWQLSMDSTVAKNESPFYGPMEYPKILGKRINMRGFNRLFNDYEKESLLTDTQIKSMLCSRFMQKNVPSICKTQEVPILLDRVLES